MTARTSAHDPPFANAQPVIVPLIDTVIVPLVAYVCVRGPAVVHASLAPSPHVIVSALAPTRGRVTWTPPRTVHVNVKDPATGVPATGALGIHRSGPVGATVNVYAVPFVRPTADTDVVFGPPATFCTACATPATYGVIAKPVTARPVGGENATLHHVSYPVTTTSVIREGGVSAGMRTTVIATRRRPTIATTCSTTRA